MSVLPYSNSQMAEEAAAFAAKITPRRARWEYCFDRALCGYRRRSGEVVECINPPAVSACARLIGTDAASFRFRLALFRAHGFDEAEARAARRGSHSAPLFKVGPMEAWHVGHVYFARLKTHPHVVKIGFSRRVRERLDDIESKCGSSIFVEPGQLRVGTLADEHWWHASWRDTRISGEWFFDPFTTERTLPAFLDRAPVMEAA